MTDPEIKKIKGILVELAKDQRKTEAALAEMAKELGGIGNTQGEIAEDLFRRNLVSLMQEKGSKLTSVSQRVKAISEREYDLIGVNGELVAIVEVKSKVSNKNLETFVHKQIPAFRNDFPQYKKHKIIGCVAGLIVRKEIEKKAASIGLFVLTQKGKDGAQIANTSSFKAKLY